VIFNRLEGRFSICGLDMIYFAISTLTLGLNLFPNIGVSFCGVKHAKCEPGRPVTFVIDIRMHKDLFPLPMN